MKYQYLFLGKIRKKYHHLLKILPRVLSVIKANLLCFIGSAHTDEDHRGNFGGVIYIYDAKAVYLYFPDRRADTGYVINTGTITSPF